MIDKIVIDSVTLECERGDKEVHKYPDKTCKIWAQNLLYPWWLSFFFWNNETSVIVIVNIRVIKQCNLILSNQWNKILNKPYQYYNKLIVL